MDVNTRNRTELKSYFVKNSIPTESNFAELIDGMLNQKDDGLVKLPGNPLSIEAPGDDAGPKKAINFYRNFSDATPDWTLNLNPRSDPDDPGSTRLGFNISDGEGNSRLFIDRNTGQVGLGTPTPQEKLHILGNIRGDQSGALRISTGQGYVDIGPKNKNWSHFYTDREKYYFDKEIRVDSGNIGSHNENLSLRTAGTTRITVLNDNGNVGIGTNQPGAKLHINGGGTPATFPNTTAALEIDNTGDQLAILQANGSTAPYRITIQDGHGRVHHLWNAYDSGSAHKYDVDNEGAVWLKLNSGEFSVSTAAGGTAGDNVTWALGIVQNSSGQVGIGAAPDTLLTIGDGTNQDLLKFNTARGWKFKASGSGSSTNLDLQSLVDGKHFRVISENGTVCMDVSTRNSGSSVTVRDLVQTSSQQYKENITALNNEQAAALLNALKPVMYTHKEPYKGHNSDHKAPVQLGFIAEAVPDILATPDHKGIKPTNILAVLCGALQEQQVMIKNLQDEVQALQKQGAALQKQIEVE